MTNKEITSLAIKVFAIYVLIQVISGIAQISAGLDSFFQGDEKLLFLMPFIAMAGLFIVFVALWKLAGSVMEQVNTNDSVVNDFKVDQVFILNLVGFYIVFISLLGIIQNGISLVYTNFEQGQDSVVSLNLVIPSQLIFYGISNLIKLLLGISLIIKPIGWAHLFKKIRTLSAK